jgi:FtsZ-binding cell division protein ZapB
MKTMKQGLSKQCVYDTEMVLLRSEVKELKEKNAQAEQHWEDAMEDMRSALGRIEAERHDLSRENSELVSDIQDVLGELKDVYTHLTDARQEREDLKARVKCRTMERDIIAEKYLEKEMLSPDEINEQIEVVRREERAKTFKILAESRKAEQYLKTQEMDNDILRAEVHRLTSQMAIYKRPQKDDPGAFQERFSDENRSGRGYHGPAKSSHCHMQRHATSPDSVSSLESSRNKPDENQRPSWNIMFPVNYSYLQRQTVGGREDEPSGVSLSGILRGSKGRGFFALCYSAEQDTISSSTQSTSNASGQSTIVDFDAKVRARARRLPYVGEGESSQL